MDQLQQSSAIENRTQTLYTEFKKKSLKEAILYHQNRNKQRSSFMVILYRQRTAIGDRTHYELLKPNLKQFP